MKFKKTEVVIQGYLNGEIDEIELSNLIEALSDEELKKEFKISIETDYLLSRKYTDVNSKQAYLNFLAHAKSKRIKNDKIFREKRFYEILKYAAVFVALVGLWFLYTNDGFYVREDKKISVESLVRPHENRAVLTLENGANLALEKGEELKLKGRTLSGEELIYSADKTTSTQSVLQYNYLTVPKGGGEFFVQLSDGTKIWLNSDSKLKYPINFISGQARRVELVFGEAYFDVSQSTNHNGDVFIVQTSVQEIEVLGTEFNIKAYQDEKDIITTLVEGKIIVGNGIENKYLNPLDQSVIDIKATTGISVRKVDNLFDEIAWKEGYFSFRHKSMKEIMKILSRWYDIDYFFKNQVMENKHFTGVLDRGNTISEILIYIQKTNEMKFQVNDNTIIIE